jgi:LDH2 family malate/lactate/ureidoglycolate dehydrogenase
MVEKLHATPTVEGVARIRYPGERGNLTYRERSANGIPLRRHVVDALQELNRDLTLSLDDVWQV